MLNVEFLGKEEKEEGKGIRVNGVLDKKAEYSLGWDPSSTFYSRQVITLLLEYSFEELGRFFEYLHFELDLSDGVFNSPRSAIITRGGEEGNDNREDEYAITFPIVFEADHWAKPWSIFEFSQVFEAEVEKLVLNSHYYQYDEDNIKDGIEIQFTFCKNEVTGKCVDSVIGNLLSAWNTTEEILQSKLDKDKLITYFHFPSSVKTACKQYLIYFTQFLSDLGIEAETEIEEKEGTTMLKVIPENKEEALSHIREALAVYLAIPGSQEFGELSKNMHDIALAQLRANVLHLQSQWEMAKALLQMKDATIGQLQLCNYQYKQLLDGHAVTPKDAEEEDLIEGVLTVTKYKGDAFTINLPEILRKIKRKLK
ncbi:hypothetical protein [Chitinophaga sp. HK235]|uniref:hypothetical protein n=1 Tax=Chitinophaga sp. HK235 TaxID=2952571 RepID=UPI001BAD938F|nr:hypothetical protein [Chitinophaga sp. HK235]